MSNKEQWKDVVGYEGLYQVSNLGRVRNLKGNIMSPSKINRCGHLGLILRKNKKPKCNTIHRLVAKAWLGECPVGCQVLHGPNGIEDNSAANLSYGTNSQNQLDRRRDGTNSGRRVRRSDNKVFSSIAIAAEETGCSVSSIYRSCRGDHGKSGGYRWKYVN